ncbi:MAG: hypothetical protein IT456_08305 [Planctomycetes bacterium]|jgi:hypothetical protein|nr:hypothetical protein [Planctomycetota bacterium]
MKITRNHSLLLTALLVSCAGVPTRTFQIDAIDVDESPVPCIVVLGDDWAGAAENNQYVNVGGDNSLALKVPFDRPEVDIVVAAVPVDPATGKPRIQPKSRTESSDATGFLADFRRVRLTDPERNLFILRRR